MALTIKSTPPEIDVNILAAFSELEKIIETHPAANHPLFKFMADEANGRGLTPKQFEVFRHSMLGRIFDTMVNITRLQKWALKKDFSHVTHTAVANIFEESGGTSSRQGTNFDVTHRQMSENAFNALAKVFGLDASSIRGEHKHPVFSEEITQKAVFKYCYKQNPTLASWVQERASGGNGRDQKGMMGDLFGIFSAYQNSIPVTSFKHLVLPYFEAHIGVKKSEDGIYRHKFEPNSVEFQHGERAKIDAVINFKTPEEVSAAKPFVEAFLDAQNALFNRAMEEMIKAREIGLPIKPNSSTKKVKNFIENNPQRL